MLLKVTSTVVKTKAQIGKKLESVIQKILIQIILLNSSVKLDLLLFYGLVNTISKPFNASTATFTVTLQTL